MYVEFSEDMVINPSIFQGGGYLGITSISNAQIWTISGLEKNKKYRIMVISNGILGDSQDEFETYAEVQGAVIYKNDHMIWNGEKNEVWEIELTAYDSEIEIIFDYSETGDKYHYISLSQIEIEKIE